MIQQTFVTCIGETQDRILRISCIDRWVASYGQVSRASSAVIRANRCIGSVQTIDGHCISAIHRCNISGATVIIYALPPIAL